MKALTIFLALAVLTMAGLAAAPTWIDSRRAAADLEAADLSYVDAIAAEFDGRLLMAEEIALALNKADLRLRAPCGVK